MSKQRMEDNLTQGLRALAAETRDATANPRVRQALLAEMRNRQQMATLLVQRGTHIRWWQAAAAAVVLLGLGFGFAHWSRKEPVQTVVVLPRPRDVAPQPVADTAPLIDATGSATPAIEQPASGVERTRPSVRRASRSAAAQKPERWSDTGEVRAVTPWFYNTGLPVADRGQVLRLEVTAATAARFGVAASGPVQAEIFIADDGLTRAIRFVQ